MKRTQLYLDEEMSQTLAAESRRRSTTVSFLVREAVAAAYGPSKAQDRDAVIRDIAGVWADHDDIGDTEGFVRSLRRSTRPLRWRRGKRAAVPTR